jgi:capsular exopolysaccharide synthesis family protein
MSRIDDALRIWEESSGGARAERDTAATAAATTLDAYVREQPSFERTATAGPATPRTEQPVARVRRTRPPHRPVPAPADEARLVTGHVSPVALEQYRRLAAALHDAQAEGGTKTIMLTSAVPHEGKTLTSVNLALTLSESYARRVLLIDADLRWPSVHTVLGLENTRGLTEVLVDESFDLPFVNVSERLTLLTAGSPGRTPLAGLSSPRMGALLEECSRRYDWVLLDTPPIGLLPDAQVLARLVGAVILVVGAGATPATTVERAVAEIGQERIIGVVMNRVEGHQISEADYYGRYESAGD